MLKAISIRAQSALPLVFGLSLSDIAADHGDAPEAVALEEPSADIADLYAWISNDTSKLNLALTVHPNATSDAWFSSHVVYAFAISSSAAIGEPQEVTTISCKFVDESTVECWGAGDYVVGDPRDPLGIWSEGNTLRVFAGLRNDPSFVEATGFDVGLSALASSAEDDAFEFRANENGCPHLSNAQGEMVRGLLSSGEDGSRASNTLAGQNVLALVLQVDSAPLAINGPILGAWASTYSTLVR